MRARDENAKENIMGKKFPKVYSLQERESALRMLEQTAGERGTPQFTAVSRKTGISVGTLKRWWIKYQLDRQKQLRTKLEEAISSILARIENLAQETNNLKELAPVVKMLSELLQQFSEGEFGEEWG